MKELTIISGKGGTGKTSLVSSFAALASKKVLVDCDVDAADLHLILRPQIKSKESFVGGKLAEVREEDCISCDKCFELCKFDAVKKSSNGNAENMVFSIDPLMCEGCGVCAYFCPVDAIDFNEKICGEWFISETSYGPMVHARLGIAEDNSGKLVTLVRTEAKRIAEEKGMDLLITDGSPGIGCPVIASIAGVSMVIIVTEPTVSGLHDMERVFHLTKHFNIPSVVCINKFDINPDMTDKIKKFCKIKGMEIVGLLRYDSDVTRAMIAQLPVVEYSKTAKITKEIKKCWESVVRLLGKDNI